MRSNSLANSHKRQIGIGQEFAPGEQLNDKMDFDDVQPDQQVSNAGQHASEEDFERASDPALSEDLALALLKRADLAAEALEALFRNASVSKLRKVKMALASHLHTPRRIALQLIRDFYSFDLMQFALTPVVPADLKRVADELLVARLSSISLGERISLTRRGSAAVAAALLLDKEAAVWRPALENPRLTEAAVVKVLLRPTASAALVEAVSHHSKWSVRPEIRSALLRNDKTPLARILEFARSMPPAQLRDLLHNSHLPETVKRYLKKELESRGSITRASRNAG